MPNKIKLPGLYTHTYTTMVYLRTVILRRRRGLRVVRGGGDGGSGGGGGGNYGRGGSGGGRRDEDREGVSALLGGLGLGLVLDASVSRREGCVMEHGGCDGGGSCEVVVVMVASGGSDGAGGAGCCVLWGGKGVMCGSISFEPPRSISGCTLQPKSWRPIRGQVPGNDGGCRRRAIDGGQRRRHSHHANQVSVDTTTQNAAPCAGHEIEPQKAPNRATQAATPAGFSFLSPEQVTIGPIGTRQKGKSTTRNTMAGSVGPGAFGIEAMCSAPRNLRK